MYALLWWMNGPQEGIPAFLQPSLSGTPIRDRLCFASRWTLDKHATIYVDVEKQDHSATTLINQLCNDIAELIFGTTNV